MKQLTPFHRFAVLIVVAVLVLTSGASSRFLGANIFEDLDTLEFSAAEIFQGERSSGGRYDAFNRFFRNHKSDEAVLERYKNLIVSSKNLSQHPYLKEILTYVHVFEGHSRAAQQRHLPMYPEDNMMTYELAAALHLDNEIFLENAKLRGVIPQDAMGRSYMSRLGYLNMVAGLYFPQISEVEVVDRFFDMGLIDDRDLWRATDQWGFSVVEGIRVSMKAVEVYEAARMAVLSNEYEQLLIDVPEDGPVVLSDDVLHLLSRTFDTEVGGEIATEVMGHLQTRYRPWYGNLLTSNVVQEIRNEYYTFLGRGIPDAAVLPDYLDLGSCSQDLSYKLNLGSYVEVGELGSVISCEASTGSVIVELPAHAIILNGGMAPRVVYYGSTDEYESEAFRLDFSHSLANTFLLGKSGEKKWHVTVVKNSLDSAVGDIFAFMLANDEQQFGPFASQYDDHNAAEFLIPLRSFVSDALKVYLEFDFR